jgi:hypothetical protein
MSQGNLKLLPRMKEVGMNAALVKFGGIESTLRDNDRAKLIEWARACAASDQAFLPVFNLFGGHGPAWIKDFAPYVDKAGAKYTRTPCPYSRSFWERYIIPRFLAMAAALRGESLSGICLDSEMYGADFAGYSQPCYCDECFRGFLKAQGKGDQPLPPAAERAGAINAGGQEQAYADSEARQVQELATACRKALHQANPKLRIGVFHLDWDTPFQHGMAEEDVTPVRGRGARQARRLVHHQDPAAAPAVRAGSARGDPVARDRGRGRGAAGDNQGRHRRAGFRRADRQAGEAGAEAARGHEVPGGESREAAGRGD